MDPDEPRNSGEERLKLPLDPEEALRALLAVDPESESDPEPEEDEGDGEAAGEADDVNE